MTLSAFRKARLSRLGRDTRGVTLTEFAFVGPVFILLLMGTFDMAHTRYTASLVHGAMQKAGRDLTLENAASRQAGVDQKVREQVLNVAPPDATVTLTKLSHFDFSDIAEPEEILGDDLEGAPGHGVCESAKGERYIDDNGNGRWDADRGRTGIGGARDAVLYKATVTYPRLFPMYGLAGMSNNVTVEASTVLRNQPFDEQDRNAETKGC